MEAFWAELYLSSSDKKVRGNATEAAMQAYNTKNRASAATIGYEYMRKLEFLLPMTAENLKLTLPRLLSDLYEKADDFDKLERLMVRLGYLSNEKQLQLNLNQQNNQFNFTEIGEQFATARKERGLSD